MWRSRHCTSITKVVHIRRENTYLPRLELFFRQDLCVPAISCCRTSSSASSGSLSHVQDGQPQMVDVSRKQSTHRSATAQASVLLPKAVVDRLSATATPTATAGDSANSSELMTAKGPVLATAIIAGVMAAKKTSELIPFCHPVPLHDCQVTISRSATLPSGQAVLQICCTAKTVGKTGVEMEALVGATNAALCVYDMLKAWSHEISIQEVVLLSKTGGKSGTYSRIGDTNSDNREE